MPVLPGTSLRLLARVVVGWLCVAGLAAFAQAGPSYTGRVLFRTNKVPAAGVLVEIVEAEDDGEPTDDVLGSARTDEKGRFTVVLSKRPEEKVALVVSAQRTSAKTGGDRRGEGYDIDTRRTRLGFMRHPSATKPNTVLIEHRKPRHHSGHDDDEDDD